MTKKPEDPAESTRLPDPNYVKRGRTGRPTKLTPELQERIVATMRSGCYQETAAAHCGISVSVFRKWLHDGAEGKSKKYKDFLEAVERASEDAELRALATVQEFGRGLFTTIVTTMEKADGSVETKTERRPVREWTAAAWYLERRKPGRWGRRLELQGPGGGPLAPMVGIYLPDNGRARAPATGASPKASRVRPGGGGDGRPGANGKRH